MSVHHKVSPAHFAQFNRRQIFTFVARLQNTEPALHRHACARQEQTVEVLVTVYAADDVVNGDGHETEAVLPMCG
jgi:hypothetical protein